jgi:hypothetical protein
VATPSSLGHEGVWKWWSERPYSLSTWPRRQRMVKWYPRTYIYELWFFSNCSEKQPSVWSVLPGFGLAFAFVNKCSRTRKHHHFHHLSSPTVINFEECHHLFNPEVKVSCFAMVSSSFVRFCNGLQWSAIISEANLLIVGLVAEISNLSVKELKSEYV